MVKTWIVYKHISPSGKIYVGITSKSNPNDRWNNVACKHFYNAIIKYGGDVDHLTESHKKAHKGNKLSKEHRSRIISQTTKHKEAIRKAHSKAVLQIKPDGTIIEFASAMEAEIVTVVFHNSINKCCHLVIKSAGGYKWKFKNGTEQ